MKNIKDIVNNNLNRYHYIRDNYEKLAVKTLITGLYPFIGESIPYLYESLEGDRNFERWRYEGREIINNYSNKFIIDNRDFLENLFNTFKDCDIKREGKRNQYVNDDFLKIIYEFLNSINPELVHLLQTIQRKGNLIRLFNYHTGEEIYDKSNNDIYLLIDQDNTLDNMIGLIHELGHAYPDYLYHKHHEVYNPKVVLKIESSSQVLELLFIRYLIDNDIYQEGARNYLTYFNNNLIREIHTLNKVVNSNNKNEEFTKEFDYAFGIIMAYYVILNNIPYKDFIDYLNRKDIEDIIKELNINFNEIKDSINKSYQFIKK